MTAAPEPAAHRRELSVGGQYLSRLLALTTVIAIGFLVAVALRVADRGSDFDMTGLTMPMFLVGILWLATFVGSMWMVRLEWSGLSLAVVVGALAFVGTALGRAVPPGSSDAPMYFGFGAGELAVELQFSVICAAVVFVLWAVWATMPVARRWWPRTATAAIAVGLLALLFIAWNAVPSYPPIYMD